MHVHTTYRQCTSKELDDEEIDQGSYSMYASKVNHTQETHSNTIACNNDEIWGSPFNHHFNYQYNYRIVFTTTWVLKIYNMLYVHVGMAPTKTRRRLQWIYSISDYTMITWQQ